VRVRILSVFALFLLVASARLHSQTDPFPASASSQIQSAPAANPAETRSRLKASALPSDLYACNRGDNRCTIFEFDRLHGTITPGNHVPDDLAMISAVNSSKTLFSGSLLVIQPVDHLTCANFDYKIVVQSTESAGILVYDPADIGAGVCDVGDLSKSARFLIALPVHALWADVFSYRQLLDPTRAAPAKTTNPPAGFTDCTGQPAIATIVPCDKETSKSLGFAYTVGAVANRFVPPGNGQGSVNFAGKGEVNFDIQADPAFYINPGWINFPVMFERGPSGANLNSLTFGTAYDARWISKPNYLNPSKTNHLTVRKPQVQFRSNLEFSPSHPATGMASSLSRDWNFVFGETIKFPFIFNFHSQPSSFTIYPLIGTEEGWHLASNLTQNSNIVRGFAGGNASFRWPYNVFHNFTGPTPITFEAQYLIRGFLNKEPFADFSNLPPANSTPICPDIPGVAPNATGTGCMASLVLSSIPRSFFKGDASVPVNPYISIKFTAYRGALPPDFWNIGWSYTLGLSFSNPGSSEH
jgi:hypothetical protein